MGGRQYRELSVVNKLKIFQIKHLERAEHDWFLLFI